MDTLTHALSGAVLARATVHDRQPIPIRVQMTVGFLAAAFPDIDFIAGWFGSFAYLEYHRSITHSLVMMPLWAMLLGWIFTKIFRNKYDRKAVTLTAALSLIIHIFGDIITAYGTMALAPLNWAKLSWPTTFIIDLYFSGILLGTLILALLFRKAGRRIAVAGLAFLIIYVGYQADLQWKAEQIGEQQAQALALNNYRVHAQPQPLSPYHWKIIIEEPERYRIAYVHLLREKSPRQPSPQSGFLERVGALYQPRRQLSWLNHDRFDKDEEKSKLAKEVWLLPFLQPLRNFMMFPALAGIDHREGMECVWFRDERFVLDGAREGPFVFGACRNKGTDWRPYLLRKGELKAL